MNHRTIQRDFETYLKQVGYSLQTVYNLPRYLREFLFYTQPESFESITSAQIKAYYGYLSERPNYRKPGGLSGIMIRHHLYGLRVFFGWLETTELITGSPLAGLDVGPPAVNHRQALSQEEIQELYAHAQQHSERVLLGLFYGCGLRKSEAQALETKDLHLRDNLLYVRSGKGGKRRAVPVSDQVKEDLHSYYQHERSQPGGKVLQTVRSPFMGDHAIYRRLNGVQNRAKLSNRVTPHVLRHSIATHLLENGLAVEQVRDFLGHKHLESTQVYIRTAKL